MLRDAVTVEQERHAANILKEQIQWYYIEKTATDDQYELYDVVLNFQIEKAYKANLSTFNFR